MFAAGPSSRALQKKKSRTGRGGLISRGLGAMVKTGIPAETPARRAHSECGLGRRQGSNVAIFGTVLPSFAEIDRLFPLARRQFPRKN